MKTVVLRVLYGQAFRLAVGLPPDVCFSVRQRFRAFFEGVSPAGFAGASVGFQSCVAGRIRTALRFVSPDRLLLAPDCGMKYLPRAKAFAKLEVLAAAAAKVRAEL